MYKTIASRNYEIAVDDFDTWQDAEHSLAYHNDMGEHFAIGILHDDVLYLCCKCDEDEIRKIIDVPFKEVKDFELTYEDEYYDR